MKKQLERKSFAEQEELLSLPAGLMNEIPLDMILRVLVDWS
jgi:hypothetical protein